MKVPPLMSRAYMDYNATAPMLPAALEAVRAAFDAYGNASSIHAEGRAARKLMEEARRTIAAELRALPQQVFFFGSGTEANVFALRPGMTKAGASAARLITSPTEHPCVLKGHGFAPEDVRLLKVDENGVIDLADLEAALGEDDRPALISLQLANNETGVIQPVMRVASLIEGTAHILHTDAVQAVGKIGVNFRLLGADLMTIAAHKFGGPKGVGALIRTSDAIGFPPAMIRGGGQERSFRAGTENVPAISGFAAAVVEAHEKLGKGRMAEVAELKDMFEKGLKEIAPLTHIFGQAAERLPNTTCFALEGVEADMALIRFDMAGVSVSSGSACSSGKVAPSHVLAALGASEALARSAIRVSLGWASTEDDVRQALTVWREIVNSESQPERALAV